MNGRDLIIYILENNLENEPVFKDGKLLGFLTAGEYAVKMNVGIATVLTWVSEGTIPGIRIANTLFIPANCKLNVEE